MALRSFIVQSNLTQITPNFTYCVKPPSQSRKMHEKVFLSNVSRRIMMVASMTSVLLAGEAIFNNQVANGFDFRLVAPDQTIEEADDGIRGHAQALLQIKALIESESWGETQKALRQSSSFLKQDIYTIIQNKPGSERPQLRKLYSNLFNNVTRLDYAARNKDASRVWQCYENIVVAVNDILSRI